MWIKNTDGKKDAILTLAVISFAVVMLKVIFGGTDLMVGDWTLNVQPVGADLAAALLGTNGAVYAFRRHTDRKYSVERPDPDEDVSSDTPDDDEPGAMKRYEDSLAYRRRNGPEDE